MSEGSARLSISVSRRRHLWSHHLGFVALLSMDTRRHVAEGEDGNTMQRSFHIENCVVRGIAIWRNLVKSLGILITSFSYYILFKIMRLILQLLYELLNANKSEIFFSRTANDSEDDREHCLTQLNIYSNSNFKPSYS